MLKYKLQSLDYVGKKPQKQLLSCGPQMSNDDAIIDVETMVTQEREWFQARVMDGLQKTKNVFSAFKQEYSSDLSDFTTLDDVLSELGDVGSNVFRSLYSKKEWEELEQSQEAVLGKNVRQVRAIRMERQRSLLKETRSTAVDIIDANVVEEFKAVLLQLTELVTRQEGRVEPLVIEEEEEERDDDSSTDKERLFRRRSRSFSLKQTSAKSRKKNKFVVLKDVKAIEEQQDSDQSKENGKEKEEDESNEEEHQEQDEKREKEEEEDADYDEGGLQPMDEDEDDVIFNLKPQRNQQLDITKILTSAEESITIVRDVLTLKGKSLPVGSLVPPDPRDAQETQGEVLVKNRERLTQCLATPSLKDLGPTQKISKLISWWALCKRAFAIASLLEHYRNTYRGTFMEEYQNLVDSLDISGLAYGNACKYERLSKFLCEYPLFIYQIELTSLSKWEKYLSKDRLKLDPVFKEDFWKRRAPGNNDDQPNVVCYVCGTSEHVAEIWNCSECNRHLHASCCEYEEEHLCKEVILIDGDEPTTLNIYCKECLPLDEVNKTQTEVVDEMKEYKAFSIYLNSEECPFDFEQTEPDGYCIFSILEQFAKDQFEYSNSSNEFCKDLADAALKSLEMAAEELQNGDLEQANAYQTIVEEAKEPFQTLKGARNRVNALKNGLWIDIEVQHLLRGYVSLFPGVQVIVYGHDGRGKVLKQEEYGNGDKNSLYILHWKAFQHYDQLVLKE